jgi:hypothetical protein
MRGRTILGQLEPSGSCPRIGEPPVEVPGQAGILLILQQFAAGVTASAERWSRLISFASGVISGVRDARSVRPGFVSPAPSPSVSRATARPRFPPWVSSSRWTGTAASVFSVKGRRDIIPAENGARDRVSGPLPELARVSSHSPLFHLRPAAAPEIKASRAMGAPLDRIA